MLEGRLTDAKAEVSNELKQRIVQLEEELQAVQAAVKATQDTDAGARQQQVVTVATLRAQLETRNKTVAALQERLAAALAAPAAGPGGDRDRTLLEKRVAELEETLREKERLIAEKDMLYSVAMGGVEAKSSSELNASKQIQRKSATEITELRAKLTAALKEREDAFAQVQEMRKTVAQREAAIAELQQGTHPDHTISSAASICATALQDALKQLAQSLGVSEEFDLSVSAVSSGRIGLYPDEALSWNRKLSESVGRLQDAVRRLRREVEDIPNRVRVAQNAVEMEKERQKANFEEQMQSLRSKLARRDSALEGYNGDLASLAEMRTKLAQVEGANAELQAEVRRQQGKLSEQQRQLAALTHELDDAKRLCEQLGLRRDSRVSLGSRGSATRVLPDALKKQMQDTRTRVQGGDYTASPSS